MAVAVPFHPDLQVLWAERYPDAPTTASARRGPFVGALMVYAGMFALGFGSAATYATRVGA